MSTLKIPTKDAGTLIATFLGICIHLTRDEIFFWSRSEDELKKLLLQPISKLNELTVLSSLNIGKQHRLDESPYHSHLELHGQFVDICHSMTPTQVKFWVRKQSQGLLLSLLRKGEIDFLPTVEGVTHLPPLPEREIGETFRSKNFVQDQNRLHDVYQKLNRKYFKTDVTEASCATLACTLSGNEMIKYIGGIDAVRDVAFTPEQIRWLASEQRREREQGLLHYGGGYNGGNYFPVVGAGNKVSIISLKWSRPFSPKKDTIGRWHYWILDTNFRCGRLGRFFIRG